MNVDSFQEILGQTMAILMVCYVITTGILYLAAKMKGYNPVGVHVKSNWDININLKFLSDLRKNYIALGKPKIISWVNFISFYGIFLGFILALMSEFVRYY